VIGTPRNRARLDRRGLLPLAVVLALGGPLRATPQGADPAAPAVQLDVEALAAVERILTPPASAPKVEPKAVVAAIVQLGPPAVGVVVALLGGEIGVAHYVPGSLEEPVQAHVLELRTEILRAALAGFRPADVLAHVDQRLAAEPGMDVRLMLAGVLGAMPEMAAFERLLALVDGIEPIHLMRTYVQTSVEATIAAHLARDARCLAELDRRAFRAGPELLGVYARSVGSARSSRGVEVLAGWLGRDAQADAAILTQIGRAAGERGVSISSGAAAAVRRHALAEDLQVQRAAVVALGRLRDVESFETLVAVLEHGPSLASTSARWSLSRICDLDLGDPPQGWKDWRGREEDWWAERSSAVLESLHSDQESLVLQSMAELLRHPLHRDAVAEILGPMLAHTEANVARAACAALARLESARALPWLLEALAQPDPELRRLACETLTRLTGLALPPDPLVWAKQLAS
jgi:HEAT repeat protein